MKRKIFAFVMCFLLIFNTLSISVFADGGGNHLPGRDEWDNWSLAEKGSWWLTQMRRDFGALGFFFSTDAQSIVNMQLQTEYDVLKQGEESYQEWLARNLHMEYPVKSGEVPEGFIFDGTGSSTNSTITEPQYIISDELSDAMYAACNKYINEYTGWMNLKSYDFSMFYGCFANQEHYNRVADIIKNKKSNQIALFSFTSGRLYLYLLNYDGLYFDSADCYDSAFNMYTEIYSDDTWVIKDYDLNKDNGYQTDDASLIVYSKSTGLEITSSLDMSVNVQKFTMYPGVAIYPEIGYSGMSHTKLVVDDSSREYRVYKTFDEYKAYSVDTRPYYVSNDFLNYDASQNNEITINNINITYNDIVDAMPDDGDGLTEEEIRIIIDEILRELDDDDGSGGSGSGGGSDGGWDFNIDFNGLIEGIVSLLEGLLNIIGKLLEYITKAVTLLTDTILQIIEIIPNNITALLSALFPFIPQEWTFAIQLSLVFGIILGIVRMFT